MNWNKSFSALKIFPIQSIQTINLFNSFATISPMSPAWRWRQTTDLKIAGSSPAVVDKNFCNFSCSKRISIIEFDKLVSFKTIDQKWQKIESENCRVRFPKRLIYRKAGSELRIFQKSWKINRFSFSQDGAVC